MLRDRVDVFRVSYQHTNEKQRKKRINFAKDSILYTGKSVLFNRRKH